MTRQHPNIILIFADQLRADALGCYGNPVCKTPNLDRLAQDGTRLDQCMVTQPTCTPCRASVLTGMYPSALRSRMVGCRTPDDARFLPRVLAGAGYHTASIGKIHMVPQREEPQAVQDAIAARGSYYGFEHVDLVNGHADYCFGPEYTAFLEERVPDSGDRYARRKYYEHGVQSRACPTHSYEFPAEVHSSNYIGMRVEEFLAEKRDKPFFLHVSFPDPHAPFAVPEPHASMYNPEDMPAPLPPVTESIGMPAFYTEAYLGQTGSSCDRVIGTPHDDYSRYTAEDWQQTRAIYYGMTTLVDENVGRILRALEDQGLADNTIVLFVSDHGDYLGDHGLQGKGFPFDCVLRTPVIVRGPGVRSGQRFDGMGTVLDIAPTLLDLAGVDTPPYVQGTSMGGSLRCGEDLPRDAVLTENDDDMGGVRYRTLTTREWKLTHYLNEDFGELFDRQRDPEERVNRWADPECAAVKNALMNRMLDEVLCSQDQTNGRVQNPVPPIRRWAPVRK